MPDITSYVNWASVQRVGNQVVALQNDRVTGLSWWERLKGGLSAVRQSAVTGFKTALTEAYGETIADLAFKSSGVEKAGRLTANMIMSAKTAAQNLEGMKTLLLPANASAEERERAELTLPYAVKANSLLSMSPATQHEALAFYGEIDDAVRMFEKDPRQNAVVQRLRDKKNEVLGYMRQLPFGEDAKGHLAGIWTKSLADACSQAAYILGEVARRNQDKWGGLVNVAENLKRLSKEMSEEGVMLNLLVSKKKGLGDELQARFNACFKEAGYGKEISSKVRGVKFSEFVKAFNNKTLNEGEWTPIRKRFTGILGGNAFSLESDITPGRYIDQSIGAEYDKRGFTKVNAFNCHHKSTACAVNLATTELKIDGRTVFGGVRHGIHNAKGVRNNAEANVERARQTVCAALVEHLKRFPADAAKDSLELNMTSISLVSSAIKWFSEASMQKAQEAAWRAISGREITVEVNGRQYKVKPKIHSVNFGVNSIAAGNVAGLRVFNRIFGGPAKNRAAMDAILRSADDFRSDDSKVMAAVRTLRRQIREIYEGNAHHSDGHEAYKLPSRLAVLTYLMGGVPVWNCKSGKDRTGMLDVEAKFLATLIERDMPIPEPGDELTDEQKELFNTLVLQSGNHEMQKYNTGAAGYKLTDSGMKGVASIGERAGFRGDAEKRRTFQGLSGYVGS